MTSNVGAQNLRKDSTGLGFLADSSDSKNKEDAAKNRVMEEVKKTFRPEFLNRVDEIIVFDRLSDEELKQIVDIMLQDVAKLLQANHLAMDVTDGAKDELLKAGKDYAYGARPLRRAIQKMLEDRIAEMMLSKKLGDNDTVIVDVDSSGKLTFAKK